MSDGSGKARKASLSEQAGLQGESGTNESPRRLTTHQKAVLIQVLRAFTDEAITVHYSPSSSDALNYAEDFSTIFKAIGWEVVSGLPVAKLPYSSSGLTIVVRDKKLPPSAEALRDALRIYGIEVQFTSDLSNLCGRSNFALVVTGH